MRTHELPIINDSNYQVEANSSSANSSICLEDITADAEKIISDLKNHEGGNVFPFGVFPKPIQEIIKETNASLNFPIDFISGSILFAASAAIGNTHKVYVKQQWIESAVIYMAIVARPGTNKSAPVKFSLRPLFTRDSESYKQYQQKRQAFEQASKLNKKEREEAAIDEPIAPIWEKFILSDFTPEALTQAHKNNKRGIGVYADELAGWIKNFNRYSKGSEMEFWLSAWSGSPINIDRKTGEPVFIISPFISVIGTIQNGLLTDLAKDNRAQNGFIDRILFIIPDNISKPYWNEAELPFEIVDNWNRILGKIVDLPLDYDENQNPISKLLHFSSEAKQLLIQWQNKNTDQSNNPENEHLSGIYSKLETYVIRLALILQILYWSCGEKSKENIGVKAMNGAIQLIEYFGKSALKVHSHIFDTDPLSGLPVAKQKLYNALPDGEFSTEEGVKTAAIIGMPERTFKRFIKEKNLFRCISHGRYEKLFL
jgi:hypothetical protein